jgi:hypothetical protein
MLSLRPVLPQHVVNGPRRGLHRVRACRCRVRTCVRDCAGLGLTRLRRALDRGNLMEALASAGELEHVGIVRGTGVVPTGPRPSATPLPPSRVAVAWTLLPRSQGRGPGGERRDPGRARGTALSLREDRGASACRNARPPRSRTRRGSPHPLGCIRLTSVAGQPRCVLSGFPSYNRCSGRSPCTCSTSRS